MYQSCGATMWRLAMPALSNTPARRSNRALLPPNASRARAFASCCSTTVGGTAVASESKEQGCIMAFISGPQVERGSRYEIGTFSDDQARNANRPMSGACGVRDLLVDYGPADERFRREFRHFPGLDLRQSLGAGVPAGDEDRDRHRKARTYLAGRH